MSEGIPARVRDFVLANVDSIESLEVLLMLAARPESTFTPEQASEEMRTSPSSAANRLKLLHEHNLVDALEGNRYRVRPGAELAETLQQVARTYRDWRVSVVTLIYSRPSDVVRVFTDSFVLNRGPKDG